MDRNPAAAASSKAWQAGLRQQRLVGAAADVVDAGIDGAGPRDLDQNRGVEFHTIVFAQHQREVGAFRIPGGLEVATELDLRRAVRPTGCELPRPVGWLVQTKLGKLRLEALRGLLERKRPVVKHIALA